MDGTLSPKIHEPSIIICFDLRDGNTLNVRLPSLSITCYLYYLFNIAYNLLQLGIGEDSVTFEKVWKREGPLPFIYSSN